jgi:hypothetical protein
MKSAGKSLFASIHQTLAAAKNTYSGFSVSKKTLTELLSVKSSSFDVLKIKLEYHSDFNFLTIADQTNQLCQAIYIFDFLSIIVILIINLINF